MSHMCVQLKITYILMQMKRGKSSTSKNKPEPATTLSWSSFPSRDVKMTTKRTNTEGQYHICMVCDFFYPRMGGVEMHIWCLAQCLLRIGHKVVIVTHAYDDRKGIRHMNNGLKIYYCPLVPFYDQDVWPTLYAFFPLFRQILIREEIDIVHTHQATSVMSIECALYARCMGYKVVYTDHSLFGFADAASIHINQVNNILSNEKKVDLAQGRSIMHGPYMYHQVMKFILSDVDHVICVSNTCRENLCLRARLHPSVVSTIPNAVDPSKFTPDPTKRRPTETINIVIISRLVYRKGIDLVAKVIPAICAKHPDVHFIVGGDGNKKLLLEEMREKHQLHDRVELLGSVAHAQVREVLVRGHMFLNCSLTESFCIAILEAACCGLFVVSTKVGGVPEVLPPSMICFAEPTAQDVVKAVESALPLVDKLDPMDMHTQIREAYDWMNVAQRTVKVYSRVSNVKTPTFGDRLARYSTMGSLLSGWLCCFSVTVMHFVWMLIDWMWPSIDIERAVNFHCSARDNNRSGI